MTNKFYTGIGSRNTPESMKDIITRIAQHLHRKGHILRSGHADGPDLWFEHGADDLNSEIYLPWPRFGADNTVIGNPICFEDKWVRNFRYLIERDLVTRRGSSPEDDSRNPNAKLFGRNYAQIMGLHDPSISATKQDMQKSNFVLCYCPIVDNKPVGGTGLTIKIAQYCGVPIYNLFLRSERERIERIISKGKE